MGSIHFGSLRPCNKSLSPLVPQTLLRARDDIRMREFGKPNLWSVDLCEKSSVVYNASPGLHVCHSC